MSNLPSDAAPVPANESKAPYAGRRVWVTGATGFVGWHLSERLAQSHAKVSAISRGKRSRSGPTSCSHEKLDLEDLSALRNAFKLQHPEIIFHLAGLVTAGQDVDLVEPTLTQNLVATVHLLLAAKEFGVTRVVLVGSSEEPADLNATAHSPYAAAKAASQVYAQMFHKLYGVPLVSVRPFFTYGPRQDASKLIPHVMLALLRGQSPKLSQCRRVCDFVYVDDLVDALLETGTAPNLEGQRIDLGGGRGVIVRDVVDEVARMIGGAGSPDYGALPDRENERSQVADYEHTRTLLRWTPRVPLQEGLARTLAWYRDQGRSS